MQNQLIEEWRIIPETDGIYSVSNFGRIRREVAGHASPVGKVLKLSPGSAGYYRVHLSVHGRRISLYVHQIVLRGFIGPRPPNHQANHINGVKTDNPVTNLEWVTASENTLHASRVLGVLSEKTRFPQGPKHPHSKLTASQADYIRASSDSIRFLANRFPHVTYNTIYKVKAGHSYRLPE